MLKMSFVTFELANGQNFEKERTTIDEEIINHR